MGNRIYLFMYEYNSERTIGGVFSTRAAAEEALRLGDETSEVLEYVVDAPLPPNQPGRSLWKRYYSVDFPEYTGYPIPAYEPYDEADNVTFDGTHYAVTVWAVDEADALQQSVETIEQFRQAHTT